MARHFLLGVAMTLFTALAALDTHAQSSFPGCILDGTGSGPTNFGFSAANVSCLDGEGFDTAHWGAYFIGGYTPYSNDFEWDNGINNSGVTTLFSDDTSHFLDNSTGHYLNSDLSIQAAHPFIYLCINNGHPCCGTFFIPGMFGGWTFKAEGGRYVLVASPTITSQPQATVVTEGNTATLAVTAAGSAPLTYQWWLNGNRVAGATSSTLTIANVQLANAGYYSVVVSNSYGSVASAAAELTVISTPTADVSPPPYPTPPATDAGKDNLIFITHGRNEPSQPVDIQWIYDMASAIRNVPVPSNWTVVSYPWIPLSLTNIFTVNAHATTAGAYAGWAILDLGQRDCPSGHWSHIHFIAHSAGAALVEEAARIVRSVFPDTEIHTTLLDPYTGIDDGFRATYGMNSTFTDNYFDVSADTWDVDVGELSGFFSGSPFGRTSGPLLHAHGVDVTALDSAVVPIPSWCSDTNNLKNASPCNYRPTSTHSWPHEFYFYTIPPSSLTGSAGYGFPLSKEGGGWDSRPNTVNNVVVLGTVPPPSQAPDNRGSGGIFDFTTIPNAISPTGSVQTYPDRFTAASGGLAAQLAQSSPGHRIARARSDNIRALQQSYGTPVWISVPVETQSNISFISCDITFTSQPGAAGLLTVYWNDQEIDTIDEQYATSGTRTYTFTVSSTFLNKNNCLAFRLDPFSSVSSSVAVANVFTGIVGLPEPPVVSIVSNEAGSAMFSLTGPTGYTFLIEASSDLTIWSPISTVSLTNNSVATFTDLDSGQYTARFYRAVSP
jgi:hypothetical protein